MKIQRTITLRLDLLGNHTGVLTALSDKGEPLDSHTVDYSGNSANDIGNAVKMCIHYTERYRG